MPELNRFTRFALIFYSGMMCLAMAIGWWRGHISLWIQWDTAVMDVLLGVGVGLAIVVVSRVGAWIPSYRALLGDFSKLLSGLTWADVFFCALASSVGEELLFRGILQPELGLPIATLLFGLLHVGNERRYLWWTGFALIVGVIFGLLASMRGSLVSPILAHFVVNLINLRYLSQYEKKMDKSAEAGEIQPTE